MMCCANPAWWALGISILALVVSVLTFLHRKRKFVHAQERLKSEVQRNLVRQQQDINEAFVRLDVKSPYAHHLGIDDAHVKEFTAKSVMLFNQLNMMCDVYQNRKILGDDELKVYEKWARTILKPWIEADADLKRVWFLAKESEDLMHPEFSSWLNGLLPIFRTE